MATRPSASSGPCASVCNGGFRQGRLFAGVLNESGNVAETSALERQLLNEDPPRRGCAAQFHEGRPCLSALQAHGFHQLLVHTGQHYDAAMSEVFFQQLGLPAPDFNLEVARAATQRRRP